ncbi:MAG: hypothetical protein ACJAS4_000437 [Bacteriovoracaceae bacterium]|jgi:hypothetical protein
MVALPKYSIVSSVKGANVYTAKGKLLGQTPLRIEFKDIQDGVDGEFVTLIVEKESYHTRVIFFEAERSVELKIDLKRDEFFQDNKYQIMKSRNSLLAKENSFLKMKIDSSNELMLRHVNKDKEIVAKAPENTIVRPEIEKTLKSSSKKKIFKKKKLKKKIVRNKKVPKGYLSKRNGNLRPELINEFLLVQSLINKRKFDQAKHDLYEIDKKNPNLTTTLNLLTYIELESGNYNLAQVLLDRTISLGKKDTMTDRLVTLLNKLSREHNTKVESNEK